MTTKVSWSLRWFQLRVCLSYQRNFDLIKSRVHDITPRQCSQSGAGRARAHETFHFHVEAVTYFLSHFLRHPGRKWRALTLNPYTSFLKKGNIRHTIFNSSTKYLHQLQSNKHYTRRKHQTQCYIRIPNKPLFRCKISEPGLPFCLNI